MHKKHSWKQWGAAAIIPPLALCLLAYSNIVTIRRQTIPAAALTDSLYYMKLQIQAITQQTEQIAEQLLPPLPEEPPLESKEELLAPVLSLTPEEQEELDKLIASYGKGVSVYYKSLTRGDIYEYAADTEYYIASIVKAPYALYLYQLADKGLCDLSQIYPYQAKYNQGDYKILQQKSPENRFTLGDLLEVAIRYSNNTAFKMIREAYPVEGFLEFVRTLGLEDETCMDALTDTTIHGSITAHDAGIIMENIYRYTESNAPNAKKYKEDLLHTQQPMLQSKYPLARKLGSWDGAMHDMAIVYAPEPYILTVCTNRGHSNDSAYREKDYRPFLEISEKIELFSQNKRESAG